MIRNIPKEVLKGTSYEDMDFKSILAGSLAEVE
jgi:hypothetical protein